MRQIPDDGPLPVPGWVKKRTIPREGDVEKPPGAASAFGRLGGKACFDKHGREYYRALQARAVANREPPRERKKRLIVLLEPGQKTAIRAWCKRLGICYTDFARSAILDYLEALGPMEEQP